MRLWIKFTRRERIKMRCRILEFILRRVTGLKIKEVTIERKKKNG
jgi:hypothetical protein